MLFHVERNGTIGTKHKNRHRANETNKPASETGSNNSDKQTTSVKTTTSNNKTETKINYTECVNTYFGPDIV